MGEGDVSGRTDVPPIPDDPSGSPKAPLSATEHEALHNVLIDAETLRPTGGALECATKRSADEPMSPRRVAFDRLHKALALTGRVVRDRGSHPRFFNMKITEIGRDLLAAYEHHAEQQAEQFAATRTELRESSRRNLSLHREIDDARAEIAKLKAENERVQTLEAEVEQMAVEVETLRKMLDSDLSELEIVRAQRNAAESGLAAARKGIDELQRAASGTNGKRA